MTRPDKSRVGTDAAMRARDVSRPREDRTPDPDALTEASRREPRRADVKPRPGGPARHAGGSRPDSS